MRKEEFTQLIDKYLSGSATPGERLLVEDYYSRLASFEPVSHERQEYEKDLKERVLESILQSGLVMEVTQRNRRIPGWIWAAASLLLLVTGIVFYFRTRSDGKNLAKTTELPILKNDIAPGGNKAILTLSNGAKIVLDTARNGAITQQGDSRVSKLADGQLAYKNDGVAMADAEITYNTLTTPRGGEYTISLPDGSKVWLNASSSLTYPTMFTKKERRVEVTGEAYFEIAKNASSPFIVKVKDAEVQVLGTGFNVMSYQDEDAVRTTLVEGAIKIDHGTNSLTLKPGQEARLNPEGQMNLVRDADLEGALAWKNNLFSFNDDDIQRVMRQIGRWYDVDIVYEGKVPEHFNGNISRSVNVSEVFKMLQLTGSVHFVIDGKRIIVKP